MPEHDPAGPEPCPCRECQKLFALIAKGVVHNALAQVLEDLGYPPAWAAALRDSSRDAVAEIVAEVGP